MFCSNHLLKIGSEIQVSHYSTEMLFIFNGMNFAFVQTEEDKGIYYPGCKNFFLGFKKA